MATTTSTKTKTAGPDFEAAAERARETNERLLETGRKVSSTYLDGVENYISGLVQFDVGKASVSAARELITA